MLKTVRSNVICLWLRQLASARAFGAVNCSWNKRLYQITEPDLYKVIEILDEVKK